MQGLNIDKIADWIRMKRLTPLPDRMITIRDLLASGLITQVRDGVKLLAGVTLSFIYAINMPSLYKDYAIQGEGDTDFSPPY